VVALILSARRQDFDILAHNLVAVHMLEEGTAAGASLAHILDLCSRKAHPGERLRIEVEQELRRQRASFVLGQH